MGTAGSNGPTVTVLGSGGPFLTPTRVSSGYLVSWQGRPRVIVDVGGGTVQRLGVLATDVTALDAVCLTHGHIDHTGELPALVFASVMSGRTTPTVVVGQTGRDGQPGVTEMCDLLFGADGAWRYLNTFDDFGIDAREVPSDPADPSITRVLDLEGLLVTSVAVPHGMMPAVAYRFETPQASVVFSGDISGYHAPFVALARDADLLVHDMALPQRQTEHGHLHAKPSDVGRIAAEAGVKRLLLSHVMPELEPERDAAERLVREHYAGTVTWAEDLLVVTT